jgi:hypothetical protein
MLGGVRNLDAKLAALRGDPSVEDVRGALRSTSGVLIARATRIAAERNVLLDELAPAFARLCERPVQRDPGCRGKIAIARALLELGRWEEAVFTAGARLVQAEPAFGGTSDTAAELRGVCGLAFAQCARPDALDLLAELLADGERITRVAAARGLGDAGRVDAAALLRFKLLAGDDEPEVLAQACESLLHLQQDGAIDFVARQLDRGGAPIEEIAALALGGSRLDGALEPIAAWCERCDPAARRRVGYLALALTRAAHDRLLAVVADGEPDDAVAAAKALATFQDDPSVRARLIEAARGRAPILSLLRNL